MSSGKMTGSVSIGPPLAQAVRLSLHLYAGPLDSFLVFEPALGSAGRIRP